MARLDEKGYRTPGWKESSSEFGLFYKGQYELTKNQTTIVAIVLLLQCYKKGLRKYVTLFPSSPLSLTGFDIIV